MGSTNNPLWIYQWSPPTLLSRDTVGMPLCSPMANQNYQLLITNAAGDTIALDSTIMIVGSCYYAQAGNDSLICKGDSLQIGSQHYSFVDYAWWPNFMISDTAVGNPMVWPDTITWYYLQLTDTMGNISYDSVLVDVQICTGIKVISAPLNHLVRVHPNPANNSITFEFSTINSKTEISIYDIFGKEIMHKDFSDKKTFTLNISALSGGLYFYKVYNTASGKTESGKFIKE
jgi:hypothetical protein